MKAQPTLFGRDGVGETRDALDRFFTPLELMRMICLALRDRLGLYPRSVIEPSVGGGSGARAVREVWPDCFVFGVDIDKRAEGLQLCDEYHVGDLLKLDKHRAPGRFDLALGNPPFTGTTAIEHVKAAQLVAEIVALILPWGPIGGVGRWSDLMSGPGCPSEAWQIRPRPWPKSTRETALHVWEKGNKREWTRAWSLPRWKL